MEYVDVSGLGLKVKTHKSHNRGISEFIREQLDAIPEDGAVAMVTLATVLVERFPHIPKNQSQVRINMVLGRLEDEFVRLENAKGNTFIAHANK